MHFFRILAVLGTILALSTFAGTVRATELPLHPFLYRVIANGHVSWIIGTTHRREIQIDDFHPSLRKAINSTRVLLAENLAVLSDEDDESYGKVVAPHVKATGIKRILSPGAWRRLQLVIARYGDAESEYLKKLVPTLPPGTILNLLEDWRDDFAPITAAPTTAPGPVREIFDTQIYEAALAAGHEGKSLDEAYYAQQMFLENYSMKALNDFLMTYVESDGRFVADARDFSDLVDDYLRGTIADEVLNFDENFVKGQSPYHAERYLLSEIVARRHVDWYPRILSEIKAHESLIVVGVAHVIHEGDGLLMLLAREPGVEIANIKDILPCADLL